MIITIIERNGHNADAILEGINLFIKAAGKNSFKLVGPVQVTNTQGHGGYYHYVATFVKD